MWSNKQTPAPSPRSAYREELKYLYARRHAIDTLIESLQQYDRYRAPAPARKVPQLRTA